MRVRALGSAATTRVLGSAHPVHPLPRHGLIAFPSPFSSSLRSRPHAARPYAARTDAADADVRAQSAEREELRPRRAADNGRV